MKRAWIAALLLLAAAGALAAALLLARRPPAPPAPPAPAAAVPASFRPVAGKIEGDRVLERALLAFPGGVELALREGSVFSAAEEAGRLVLRLDAGEAWLDLPERPVPLLLRTPHAAVEASRAGLNVRAGPPGTSVTVAHGSVTVAGSPFRQEISRDETIDVAPDGALGKPLRIDPAAILAWAREARDRASRLPNGGFEDGFLGWTPGRYDETEVRLDRRAHAGRQSALVHFNAVRDYEHVTPASDPFPVAPGASCRFTGYVEFADLEVGPGGSVALEVRDARGPDAFSRSAPLWSGSSGWRKFTLEFELPAETRQVRVLLTRVRNGSPTQGRIRMDDLAFFEFHP